MASKTPGQIRSSASPAASNSWDNEMGWAVEDSLMRMQKRNFTFPALLACAAWSVATPLFSQDDRIYWLNNYPEALREARQTQKPIFLEFRCEP